MYQTAKTMFLICETPLHAGSGSDIGVIDNPIQREGHTNYPKIEGSSIKGAIREVWEEKCVISGNDHTKSPEINKLFGPESPQAGKESAGTLGFSDARILLFPVKTAKGVFAWVTCPNVLSQWERDMKLANAYTHFSITGIPTLDNKKAVVNSNAHILGTNKIILEEWVFSTELKEIKVKLNQDEEQPLGKWLADKVLSKHTYWKNKLSESIVIVSDDTFQDLVMLHTEVITRNRISLETGTAASGALFTEEYLPCDSIMYTLVMASPEFSTAAVKTNAVDNMNAFTKQFSNTVFQLGGNATIGKGILRTQIL